MQLIFFASAGWETWDVAGRSAIPDRMPVLADDDLLFEDDGFTPAGGGGEPVAA